MYGSNDDQLPPAVIKTRRPLPMPPVDSLLMCRTHVPEDPQTPAMVPSQLLARNLPPTLCHHLGHG